MAAEGCSELHLRGECTPCTFWLRPGAGCHFGSKCKFCHLCTQKELKIHYYNLRKEASEKRKLEKSQDSPDVSHLETVRETSPL